MQAQQGETEYPIPEQVRRKHSDAEETEQDPGMRETTVRENAGQATVLQGSASFASMAPAIPERRTLLFVVNPKAGRVEIKNNLLDIIDTFVKSGWTVVVRTTQYAGELVDILREEGHLYYMVVCAGGDGTLSEAVSGVLQSPSLQGGFRPRLGYIPAGTTNDFAVSLGLPRNAHKAAQSIATGMPFSCDVGRFNQQYFVYVAAFGAFADVSYSTPQESKNALGRAAYILEGIRRLPEIKGHRLTVTHGAQSISGEFIFGMVSNSVSVGGFKMSGLPDVSMDDGLLEVLLVKLPTNPQELQNAIGALLLNDINNPCLIVFHTRHLQIRSEKAIPWTLDGEFGGELSEVDIEVLPRAYEIMVPLRSGAEAPNSAESRMGAKTEAKAAAKAEAKRVNAAQ